MKHTGSPGKNFKNGTVGYFFSLYELGVNNTKYLNFYSQF